MSRMPARVLRVASRFLRPMVKDALDELCREALDILHDDDRVDAWIDAKSEALDDARDFTDIPLVGPAMERWDREVYRSLLAAGVEKARDNLAVAA